MVKDLDGEEKILTFNHFTGEYEIMDILVIVNHGKGYNEKIRLLFDDNSYLDIMTIHGMFCLDDNIGYIEMHPQNVEQLIGKHFAKLDPLLEHPYISAQLIGYEIYEVYEESYSLDSVINLNAYANGFLTVTTFNGTLNNYYDYYDGITFDSISMQNDISLYGLYDYSTWSTIMPIEAFYALNIPHYKATIEKNNLQMNELVTYWIMFLDYQEKG